MLIFLFSKEKYDTLLFSIVNRVALKYLFEVVFIFEKASGLEIKLSKSELLGIHMLMILLGNGSWQLWL